MIRGAKASARMCTCEVSPSSGHLRPGESVECEVHICLFWEGRMRVSVPVHAEGSKDGSTFIHITADVVGPRIKFNQPGTLSSSR